MGNHGNVLVNSHLYSDCYFINTYYTGRLFHLGYREQLADFLPYFILALIANIPAYMLTYTSLSAGIQLVLGTLISLSVYILLLKIKHDEMYFW